MIDELPKGWAKTTLGEVAESMKNGIYKPASFYTDDGIACLRMYNISGGEIVWRDIKRMRLSEDEIQEYELRPEDLLVNRVNSRELVGKAARIPPEIERCIFESKNIRVRLITEVALPAFVNYGLLLGGSDYFRQNAQQVVGMASINQPQVARFPISLPPLREQRQIVAKLDTLLSRLSAGEAAAHRAADRLKRYRAAVLHAAATGKLTHEWREKQKPKETSIELVERMRHQRRVQWEEAAIKRFQISRKAPKDDKWRERYDEPIHPKLTQHTEIPEGWSWISFNQATLNFDGLRVPVKAADRTRRSGKFPYYGASGIIDQINDYLFDGDYLLVAEDGANLLSRSTPIAFPANGKFWVNNHAHVVQPVLCPREFIAIYLNSIDLSRFVTGTAQPKLNQANLNRIPIPIPPLEEQFEIVREVECRFVAADHLAERITRQLERAKAMRLSILREAFAGKLVQQNPTDEPAHVALNRAHAIRKAQAPKTKLKRMPKSKPKTEKRPLLEVLREHDGPLSTEALFRESGYEALFRNADEPQDVVDAFYRELRRLTEKPAKVSEEKNAKHQVTLRALT